MVFVKINANFIDINMLSKASTVPVEQIEEIFDRSMFERVNEGFQYSEYESERLEKVRIAAQSLEFNSLSEGAF